MNLIDKDSVVATIKKHLEEERHSYFCKCLLSEIDSLNVEEQPSLPSDLDEAAGEYVKDYGYTEDDYKRERIIAQEHFKAGAEWMAGQGVISEGKVFTSALTSYVKTPGIEKLLKEAFPKDTEVIVQIRKK